MIHFLDMCLQAWRLIFLVDNHFTFFLVGQVDSKNHLAYLETLIVIGYNLTRVVALSSQSILTRPKTIKDKRVINY